MSVESVKHFLDKVYSDQAIMNDFTKFQSSSNEDKAAMSLERGAELGFDFTAQEFTEVNQIKQFWQSVSENTDLSTKLDALDSGQDPEAVVAGVVALAGSAGFKFSVESLATLSQLQLKEDAGEELSMDDLEGVAEGRSFGTFNASSYQAVTFFSRLNSPTRPGGINLASTIMCPW